MQKKMQCVSLSFMGKEYVSITSSLTIKKGRGWLILGFQLLIFIVLDVFISNFRVSSSFVLLRVLRLGANECESGVSPRLLHLLLLLF